MLDEIQDITAAVIVFLVGGTVILVLVMPLILFGLAKVSRLWRQLCGRRVLLYLAIAWCLVFAADLVWRTSGGAHVFVTEAGGSELLRLGLLCLGGFAFAPFVLWRLVPFVDFSVRMPFVWFTLLGVLDLASVLWSPYPSLTVFKSAEYLFGLVVAAAVAGAAWVVPLRTECFRIAKCFFDLHWTAVFLLLLSVYVGLIIWPTAAIEHLQVHALVSVRLTGVLPALSANSVGELSALLASICIVRLYRGFRPRSLYASVFLFAVVTLFLSQTRSAMVGFLVAILLMMIVERRIQHLAIALIAATGLLVTKFGSDLSGLLYGYLLRGQDTDGLVGLSGRVGWWETALQTLQGHFLTGMGGFAGSRYVFRSVLANDSASMLHNAYVETIVDVGLPGLILVVLGVANLWFATAGHLRRNQPPPIARVLQLESLAVLSILSVRSLFSVDFVYPPAMELGLVMVCIVVSSRWREMRREAQEMDAIGPWMRQFGVTRSSLKRRNRIW